MNSEEGTRGGRVRAWGDVKCHDVTLDRLRKLLDRHQKRSGGGRVRSGIVSTGFERLDEALPGGGLPTGSVIEVLCGGSGAGAWTLALRIADCRLRIPPAPDPQSAIHNLQSPMWWWLIVMGIFIRRRRWRRFPSSVVKLSRRDSAGVG